MYRRYSIRAEVIVIATTNITVRMDEELKKQAEELFSDLGFNMTTVLTAFVKQAKDLKLAMIRRSDFFNECGN